MRGERGDGGFVVVARALLAKGAHWVALERQHLHAVVAAIDHDDRAAGAARA